MYGSTAYGICTNETICDIDIDHENHSKSSSQLLRDAGELIKQEMSDLFESSQVTKLLNGKSNKAQASQNPNKITLTAKKTFKNVQKVSFNFTSGLYATAYKTSSLIKAYFQLDERVKILAFVFRHIAKVK